MLFYIITRNDGFIMIISKNIFNINNLGICKYLYLKSLQSLRNFTIKNLLYFSSKNNVTLKKIIPLKIKKWSKIIIFIIFYHKMTKFYHEMKKFYHEMRENSHKIN